MPPKTAKATAPRAAPATPKTATSPGRTLLHPAPLVLADPRTRRLRDLGDAARDPGGRLLYGIIRDALRRRTWAGLRYAAHMTDVLLHGSRADRLPGPGQPGHPRIVSGTGDLQGITTESDPEDAPSGRDAWADTTCRAILRGEMDVPRPEELLDLFALCEADAPPAPYPAGLPDVLYGLDAIRGHAQRRRDDVLEALGDGRIVGAQRVKVSGKLGPPQWVAGVTAVDHWADGN